MLNTKSQEYEGKMKDLTEKLEQSEKSLNTKSQEHEGKMKDLADKLEQSEKMLDTKCSELQKMDHEVQNQVSLTPNREIFSGMIKCRAKWWLMNLTWAQWAGRVDVLSVAALRNLSLIKLWPLQQLNKIYCRIYGGG